MPVTPRIRTLSMLASGGAFAALLAAACAPGGGPPNIPIASQGAQWSTQVVDSTNDVGRSPSVGIDPNGSPAVSYLLVQLALKKGQIPVGPVANTPEPPSLVLASQAGGIWTRRGVTPNKQPEGNPGTATEIADSKGHYLPGVTTAMAVDKNGLHHVVWSTPSGLYYAADQLVTSGARKVPVFPSKPTQITKSAAQGASIAIAPSGAPWISFYQGSQVKSATLAKGGWTTQTVASAKPCASCRSVRTAIAFGSNGNAMIGYESGEELLLAQASVSTWTSTPVDVKGAFSGVSIATLGGEPILAYYFGGQNGDVRLATRSGRHWVVRRVGAAGSMPTGQAAPAWTTGLGVTSGGQAIVAWADLSKNAIMEAQGSVTGGAFRAQEIPESSDGWSPSAAVSSDGKRAAIAWFDSVNKHLDLAVPASEVSGLAVPSPSFSPLPTAPAAGQVPCKPSGSGTSVSVTAKNLAFNVSCLAVASGKAFTISFSNQDAGTPHNVEIYENSGAVKRLGGATSVSDTVTGVASTTYKNYPLPAGVYYFQCDVHPFMNGTFVVAKV